MDILDYIDYLEVIETHPTWLRCICPICGDKNLKINTKNPNHYYKCWSHNCNIYNYLKGEKVSFKTYTPPFRPHAKPIYIENISQLNFYTPTPYKPPIIKGNQTIYEYPEFNVYRYDTNGKKYFDLSFVPNSMYELPVYGLRYLFDDKSGTWLDSAIWVEGEKTADIGHMNKLSTFTILTTCMNYEELNIIFKVLYKRGLRNLLIFPDNDDVGLRKGNLIQEGAWKNNIRTKTIQLYNTFISYIPDEVKVSGFDLVDLLKFINVNQLLEYICH